MIALHVYDLQMTFYHNVIILVIDNNMFYIYNICDRTMTKTSISSTNYLVICNYLVTYFRKDLIHVFEATEGFPDGANGKKSTCQCRRRQRYGSISGLGRSSGVGNGNPLQCSCLENPMDRGAWWATVHGVTESQT